MLDGGFDDDARFAGPRWQTNDGSAFHAPTTDDRFELIDDLGLIIVESSKWHGAGYRKFGWTLCTGTDSEFRRETKRSNKILSFLRSPTRWRF